MNGRAGRHATMLSPALMLIYAAARWMDGRDGSHGPGPAWTIGHAAFLLAFVGFAAITIDLWRTRPDWAAANVAAPTALAGMPLFAWVIVTDLIPQLDRHAAPLAAVLTAGPLLFLGGFVSLLAMNARDRAVRRWILPPLTALGAFLMVSANLDLLPISAVLLLVALRPYAGSSVSVALAQRRARPVQPEDHSTTVRKIETKAVGRVRARPVTAVISIGDLRLPVRGDRGWHGRRQLRLSSAGIDRCWCAASEVISTRSAGMRG
jgi:hypothetical protein